MIFFVAMPFVIGLMNLIVPLQLGVRDVAFPTLNSVGFWLTATGALLVNLSLVIGEFARTGWLAFPPLSELSYSPGVGVDYYAWSLQISGVGTLVAGINLVTTFLKLRTKGMNYLRMPMFSWTTLASNLLIVAAFPILTATLAMLLLDRYLGFHFFTNEAGGNVMMFMNLIWAWGHPEVYILVLPAFGIFSEVVSTFSGKALFGYRSIVLATMAICVISFMVWLHHFFTMGAGPDVNAIFGIASMIIAIPTGVKIYNWLFTMYGGRIRFATPMLWSVGFMVTFIIGGLTGVLVAVPPADFLLHNSMFLVAHFHNVIIGGVLFGAFAGLTYWFPKAFGFRLHEGLGKAAFWFSFVGFYVTFMPLYVAGLPGMTRRMQHYDVAAWRPWMIVAAIGVVVLAIGIVFQVLQIVVSILQREELRDRTGDPWDGRSLEWATSSPPPVFNFAILPDVHGEEAYWAIKSRAKQRDLEKNEPHYEDIEMPRNSPTGFVCAFFATYAVLLGQTAGGPSGRELFNLRNVAIETGFLLASSFTCGLATIAADLRNKTWFHLAMGVTCVFGLAFLAIEAREFADLVARGAGPTRSAFLSAFFTLVGCHGLHVSAGELWLLTMMAQVFAKGFRADIQRRILCFALFWHALDIIWIAVFTIVYLLGSAS